MQTVTVRELNQHTSAVLERVSQGEELVVTRSGKPQARLSPYRAHDTYDDMVADGRIIPAVNPHAIFQPVKLEGTIDIDKVLEEERADRSWQ
jgi:prevent-host-death family protein